MLDHTDLVVNIWDPIDMKTDLPVWQAILIKIVPGLKYSLTNHCSVTLLNLIQGLVIPYVRPYFIPRKWKDK